MDNIAEGFERKGNLEFRQFFVYRKDLLEKQGLNYTEYLITIINEEEFEIKLTSKI
jgi:hypothetical protein